MYDKHLVTADYACCNKVAISVCITLQFSFPVLYQGNEEEKATFRPDMVLITVCRNIEIRVFIQALSLFNTPTRTSAR